MNQTKLESLIEACINVDYNEIFYYDFNSPTGLRWKTIRFGANGSVRKRPGDVAGSFIRDKKKNKKCINVNLNGKITKVHRIIWIMLVGSIPDNMVIDHINGDPWDNRIENLKCKLQSQNCRNRSTSQLSNLGLRGIRLAEMNQGKNLYVEARVRIGINAEYKSKRFSLAQYSLDDAINLAKQWRTKEIASLNLKGYDYTERHEAVNESK